MTRRITTIDAMALERKAKTSDNWGGILELDPTTLLYLLADRADDIARIATLEAQVNVLAKYASEFDDEGWCPACDAYNHHAPDCELKRVLDALQQRAQ